MKLQIVEVPCDSKELGVRRIVHPATGMFIGLIHGLPEGVKVELFMRVEAICSTWTEAYAFADGCWAMAEAHGLYQQAQPTTPPVIRK